MIIVYLSDCFICLAKIETVSELVGMSDEQFANLSFSPQLVRLVQHFGQNYLKAMNAALAKSSEQ